jgi:hypothetical protein
VIQQTPAVLWARLSPHPPPPAVPCPLPPLWMGVPPRFVFGVFISDGRSRTPPKKLHKARVGFVVQKNRGGIFECPYAGGLYIRRGGACLAVSRAPALLRRAACVFRAPRPKPTPPPTVALPLPGKEGTLARRAASLARGGARLHTWCVEVPGSGLFGHADMQEMVSLLHFP